MRRTQPYDAVTDSQPSPDTPIVGTAPTMRSRRVYGDGAFEGLSLFATHGMVSPISPAPYAGQGLVSPAFPLYQPSRVAPDSIRVPVLVTSNSLAPVSHADARYERSRQMPVPAAQPSIKLPTGNTFNRRGGGHQTTIQPFVAMQWPTPSQWVESLMAQGIPGGQ